MKKSNACFIAILIGFMFGFGISISNAEKTDKESIGLGLVFGAVGGGLTLILKN